MEGSSANRKPVSDGGIMEQADVPEEGDSLVGGWGRRALSSARTSPARRLINARKLRLHLSYGKTDSKDRIAFQARKTEPSSLSSACSKESTWPFAHVVPWHTNHSITIDHESRTNHTLIDLAV